MATPALAWNALGHRLVAQIAYDNLSPQARKWYQSIYSHGKDRSFANASLWLDEIRKWQDPYYNDMHYIDLPFSLDGTSLMPVPPHNAVTAITDAMHTLMNRQAALTQQQEAVKILLHVVADVHQPLHAATCVSREYPNGDKGGNLVPISHVAFARNLHAYWDCGGGWLISRKHVSLRVVRRMAKSLEIQQPCAPAWPANPEMWAAQSQQIAIKTAYAFHPQYGLNRTYQQRAQTITKQQIALAGCRLAALINHIAQES